MLKTVHVLLCAFVCCTVSAQIESLNLTEGAVCAIQRSRVSTCKYAYDCPKALQDFKAIGKKPVVCDFQDKHPILCCEPDGNPPPGTKSKQSEYHRNSNVGLEVKPTTVCKKYATSVYQLLPQDSNEDLYLVDTCSAITDPPTRGVGKVTAGPKEFPHMALIGYGSADSKSWLCGGSLISERFVLTAAFCSNTTRGLAKWVLLGEYNRKSTEDDVKGQSQPTQYDIVERINHPGYQEPSVYHNIALYRLDREVEFNSYIRPICLQTDYSFNKSFGIATGWGRLEFGGITARKLHKVNVPFQTPEKCNEMFPVSEKKIRKGILDANMFCAGDEESYICEGDGGGPLQLRLQDPYCMYTQIGVISFGDTVCSVKPDVYTRVSYYIPWIERTVWP